VATATPTTVLSPVVTRATEGDVVTAMHLSLELPVPRHHGPLFLEATTTAHVTPRFPKTAI